MDDLIKIAVLLTCHNRCELTKRCLKSVLKAQEVYNCVHQKIVCRFFLTDDKCTDDTVMLAKNILGDRLTVIHADGNAFWAGGMRLAWRKALETYECNFYLLINDDTEVWDNLFVELFSCHEYALKVCGNGGVYSGNTSWFDDRTKISFGGKVSSGGAFGRFRRLIPNGSPQRCDIVNANILMVSSNVVYKIGIFPTCYIHGAADNDYGMRANHAGLPVLITASFCGSCDADNYNYYNEMKKLKTMSIIERIDYFRFPVRSIHDTLEFSIRWRKCMVPIILLMHYLQLLSPSLYFKLFNSNKKL